MATPGVDFFRLDRGRPTKRALAAGGVLVAIGGTVVGAHLVHRLDTHGGAMISLAGGITLMCGLLIGFGTLARMMFENIWLAIRDEGIVLHDNGQEIAITWRDLGDVRIDPDGHLVLARDGAEALRWYAGGSAETIQSRIEEGRRKGIHGLPVRLSLIP